jgi:mRNA-degrading endonuclease RelE of RelBE toxin-antitoxin system
MSEYIVDFHPEVETDYYESHYWYELQKVGLGDKFLDAVTQKINKIISNPLQYGIKLKRGYREVVVDGFPYNIVYKVLPEQKRIFVSSIHHQKKKPNKKYR